MKTVKEILPSDVADQAARLLIALELEAKDLAAVVRFLKKGQVVFPIEQLEAHGKLAREAEMMLRKLLDLPAAEKADKGSLRPVKDA